MIEDLLKKTDAEVIINLDNSLGFFEELYSHDLEFRLVDICCLDNLERNNQANGSRRFECIYNFISLTKFKRFFVRLPIDQNEELPNLSHFWKISMLHQKEIFDMFGIQTQNIDLNKERIYTRGFLKGYPLRKDFDEKAKVKLPLVSESDRGYLNNLGAMEIAFLNPVKNGEHEIIIEVNEGIVQETFIFCGKKHLGIEKLFEKKSFHELVDLAGKINPYSSIHYNLIAAKSVEEMFFIEIPKRAQAIRMILSEFTRICDHFYTIGAEAFELNSSYLYEDCLQAREIINNLLEEFNKGRIQMELICIGGLSTDIPFEWELKCFNTIKILNKKIEALFKALSCNRIWKKRDSVGLLSTKDAISLSHSGPILRATGINYDVRKRFPYYFYDQLTFQVPLGNNGSCFDRYQVRIEEMRQSLGIITQLINGLPSGDYILKENPLSQKGLDETLTDKQSLSSHLSQLDINHEKMVKQKYSCIESSNGELGAYFVSDSLKSIYRFHLIPPNLGFIESFKKVSHGLNYENVGGVYTSMNVLFSELER